MNVNERVYVPLTCHASTPGKDSTLGDKRGAAYQETRFFERAPAQIRSRDASATDDAPGEIAGSLSVVCAKRQPGSSRGRQSGGDRQADVTCVRLDQAPFAGGADRRRVAVAAVRVSCSVGI